MRKYIASNKDKILNCKDFTTASFSGAQLDNASYVVYSYTTPIAICLKKRWFITRQMFSKTTSSQQAGLRLILSEAGCDVRLSNPEQFKDVYNAATGTFH